MATVPKIALPSTAVFFSKSNSTDSLSILATIYQSFSLIYKKAYPSKHTEVFEIEI